MADEDVRAKFEAFKEQWHKDTGLMSWIVVGHPAYLGIIKLGMPVVPILLEEMRTKPDWWGPALEAITGAHPCTKEMSGRLDLISKAWVDWGIKRGILK